MSNKDLFKEAIAEAKSVREAATANAKAALEETLTPHIKDLLAAKLQEMEDLDDEVEETVSEYNGFENVAEAEEEEAEDDSVESEDEAEVEAGEEEAGEDVEGDEEIGDLTVDQFKDMIKDIISQEMGGGVEDLEGDELDTGEPKIDGMGDEASMEEPGMEGEEEITVAEEEDVNIDEILAELEAEEISEEQVKEEVEESNELNEALATIQTLKKELNEVNILNSKLLYVNKIFKANNLTESQKANVIVAFDKAETVREVKLVFETVSENIVKTPKRKITENRVRGMASKATGVAPQKPEIISEVSDAVRRMQVLAGIIKD